MSLAMQQTAIAQLYDRANAPVCTLVVTDTAQLCGWRAGDRIILQRPTLMTNHGGGIGLKRKAPVNSGANGSNL